MRTLIHRQGAYGDGLVTTPVVRYLKKLGHEIVYVGGTRTEEVLRYNPNIDKFIELKKDEIAIHLLADHLEWLRKKNKCDKVLDFSESIEVALSLHPRSPDYKLPKFEKIAKYNKNFYEYAFDHAKLYATEETHPSEFYRPELFFKDEEISEAKSYLKPGFNILVGMSGSGTNKAWPHTEALCLKLCETYQDIHIITVGDMRCKLIEPELEGRITNLSGEIGMRTSMALTGLVDLVIAPDTGIIHASGCYETPKICLLGHTTKENITKHFINDYSVQADEKLAPCSPCLFLVYNKQLQCPRNESLGGASLCMSDGIQPEVVFKRVIDVKSKKRS